MFDRHHLNHQPNGCPVCRGPLHVEKLRCPRCETGVEGRFELGWTQSLSPEQLAFVRVFLLQRGKIKDVEQALGLSYPTVVSRLDDVVTAVERGRAGPPPALPEREPARPVKHRERRRQILDDLAAGAISAEEAAERLKKP